MKIADRRIKRTVLILLGVIFLIVGVMTIFLWKANQHVVIVPGQFVLVRGRPVMSKKEMFMNTEQTIYGGTWNFQGKPSR